MGGGSFKKWMSRGSRIINFAYSGQGRWGRERKGERQKETERERVTDRQWQTDWHRERERGGRERERWNKNDFESWTGITYCRWKSVPPQKLNIQHYQLASQWIYQPSSLQIRDETSAREWLEQYNQEAQDVVSRSALLAWNYATNVTDYNQQAQVIAH